MTRARSVGPDALRLVGFIAIVVGHAVPNPVVRDVVYPWHVAVFFFLTGYFWKSGRRFVDEGVRRWQTLMVPYFAWAGIFAMPLLAYDYATKSVPDVVRRAGTLVLGGTYLKSPYEAYWFMCALFVAAVLYRLLDNRLGSRGAQAVSFVALPLTFVRVHPHVSFRVRPDV